MIKAMNRWRRTVSKTSVNKESCIKVCLDDAGITQKVLYLTLDSAKQFVEEMNEEIEK